MYIMIILFGLVGSSDGGRSVDKIEFSSIESCLTAKQEILDSLKQRDYRDNYLSITCVKY